MNLIKKIKKALKSSSNDVRAAAGGECGPGMHRHPDAYHNKCHPIEKNHRKKDYKPKKKDTGDATRRIPKPKKLKLKKLQLGRPL